MSAEQDEAERAAESAAEAFAARFEAAVEALEAQQWSDGIGLLVPLITQAHARGAFQAEALGRGMLSQALLHQNNGEEAVAQAREALAAAERTDHQDTIHRCMALLTSIELLVRGPRLSGRE